MPSVSPLFIDKISLTYDMPPDDRDWFPGYAADVAREGTYAFRYRGSRYRGLPYRYAWSLTVPDTENRTCLICADCIYADCAYLRIEWNPRRMGRRGNQYIFSFLEYLLPNEIEMLCRTASVTRLDLAVDVHPITPDTMWVTTSGLRLSKLTCGPNGEIRSMRIGDERGDRHVAIYTHHDEGEDPTNDPLTTRFEVRLRNMGEIQTLQSIANPFSELIVFRAAGEQPCTGIGHRNIHFLYTVRAIGLHAALRTISHPVTRETYRRFIEHNYSIDYWSPEEIFEGYPAALEEIVGAIRDVIGPGPLHIRRRRRRMAA